MLDDLRFALRSLLRTPGFTAVAALVLAIGVGAVAAMFVFLDAYYFRPVRGVADPARLVNVAAWHGGSGPDALTYADYADLRSWDRSFSGLMAELPVMLDVGQGGDARRVPGAVVSANYFTVLGARIARGRGFAAAEEVPSHAHPVAVISDHLWRTVFAADTGLVGRTVALNGRAFTVIGVAAPGFRGHVVDGPVDAWVPLAMHVEAVPEGLTSLENRDWRWLRVVGRLAPGVDLAAARAAAAVMSVRLRAAGAAPGESSYRLSLEPTWRPMPTDTYTLLLLAGVGVLFLVVCANVSSLFLARASARRQEIATRLALGAARARIVRRLLAESLLVGLLGGALGLTVAPSVAIALMSWATLAPDQAAQLSGMYAFADVAAFVLAVAVASGLLLGLGPALWITRVDPATSLREGAGGRLPGRSRLRGALLVVQLACSLVLLSGGGLVIRTLQAYHALLPIPDARRVLLVSVQPSHQGYGGEQALGLLQQLVDRVAGLPGVSVASLARDGSLEDGAFFSDPVGASPAAVELGGSPLTVGYNVVAPGYFHTVGTPLVRGRDFTAADRGGAPGVVVINETLARRLWPGLDPLGRRLWLAWDSGGREVVGVVRDRPTRDGAQPYLFYPLYQRYAWPGSVHVLLIRTAGEPMALLPALRREAAALGLPLFDPRVVERQEARDRFFERLAGGIVGGAGALALLLAAIGLYGLTSHWVAMRTHEIGIRMALGADARQVVGVVLGRAMRLSVAGVGLGLAAALVLNRVWRGVLYHARPADPVVLGVVVAALVATALAAAWLPARRATRVDPVVALRSE